MQLVAVVPAQPLTDGSAEKANGQAGSVNSVISKATPTQAIGSQPAIVAVVNG